jgi:hypothetical protein
MPGMGIAVATELSSGAISSILEAVPGIATVLRSPVADAIVNLSRAAAGLTPFDPKFAHELIRYAVRRGLIRSDEGDRVASDIDGVAPPVAEKAVPTPAAPMPKTAPVPHAVHKPDAHRPFAPKAHAPKAPAAKAHAPAAKAHAPAAKSHAAKPHHKAKAKPKAGRPKAKSRARAKVSGKKAKRAKQTKKK